MRQKTEGLRIVSLHRTRAGIALERTYVLTSVLIVSRTKTVEVLSVSFRDTVDRILVYERFR